MTKEELFELYKNSDNFKCYMDRYCWNENLTLDVAFEHAIVKEVAKEMCVKC